MELYIIVSLLTSSIFTKYNYILEERFLDEESDEIGLIYESIKHFYKQHPESDIGSVDNLEQIFHADYPALPKKKRDLYTSIFDRLRAITLSPEVIGDYYIKLQDKYILRELAKESLLVSQGKGNEEKIKELYERRTSILSGAASGRPDRSSYLWGRAFNYHDSLAKSTPNRGLSFRAESLQKAIGPIRKGDLGIVFARPETGKTAFASDCTAYMVPQVETCAVYLANEERGEAVYSRIISSYIGKPKREISAEEAEAIVDSVFKDKLIFLHAPGLSYKDFYALLREAKPELILIDQLDKIKGFEEDRKDLELGNIYEWARQISAEFGPVIAMSQASQEAEGKRWLEQTDLANSKTSKAAEGDWILGIGKVHETALEKIRHFHIIKNKLDGDENTVEEYRHGKFDMYFSPEISRYEDTMKFRK
mgnify:CR=1 FL=1